MMLFFETLTYLFIASVLMSVFYSYYLLVLKRETCFQFNRFYLLSTTTLSLIFPLIKIPVPAENAPPTLHNLAEIVITVESGMNSGSLFSIELVLYSLYLLGIGVSLTLLVQRFWQIAKFVRQASAKENLGTYTLVPTDGKLPTSSFFNYLFWDDRMVLGRISKAQMIAHERCHIEQKHSIDLMIMELIKVVLWFNPLVYFISRDLVQTHEYLADRAALASGNTKDYKRLMLSQVLNTRLAFAHSFFHSPIKNRINMLTSKSNQRKIVVIAILTMPILGGMFFFSSFIKKIEVNVIMEQSKQELFTEVEELVEEDAEEIAIEEVEREVLESNEVETILEVEEEPDIRTFVSVEEEPKPVNIRDIQKEIGYPQIARDAGIQGNVVARVLVGTEGEYLKHKIIASAHPILMRAVEKHLHKIKFTPAVKEGKQIWFWVNVPFRFKLMD